MIQKTFVVVVLQIITQILVKGVPINNLFDNEICGHHTAEKIVGGEITQLDEFPWMALLKYDLDNGTKIFDCGGALINKRYVLTAAHCLVPSLVEVRLGEYNIKTDPDCMRSSFGEDCAPKVVDLKIEEKIIHRTYNPDDIRHFYDIGLIRLAKDVEYTDFVKPICLPKQEEAQKTYLGKKLIVAGWGKDESGEKSPIKRKTKVSVQKLGFCESKYKAFYSLMTLQENQICAGGVDGKDSCRGDSGGPLMTWYSDKKREPKFYVVGVVSYGPNPCGQKDLPGVYTKVAKFLDWIYENVKP